MSPFLGKRSGAECIISSSRTLKDLISTLILCLFKSKDTEWVHTCGQNLYGGMSSEIPCWDIVLGGRKQVLKGEKEGIGKWSD